MVCVNTRVYLMTARACTTAKGGVVCVNKCVYLMTARACTTAKHGLCVSTHACTTGQHVRVSLDSTWVHHSRPWNCVCMFLPILKFRSSNLSLVQRLQKQAVLRMAAARESRIRFKYLTSCGCSKRKESNSNLALAVRHTGAGPQAQLDSCTDTALNLTGQGLGDIMGSPS